MINVVSSNIGIIEGDATLRIEDVGDGWPSVLFMDNVMMTLLLRTMDDSAVKRGQFSRRQSLFFQ